jgi:hypothetical protein
MAVFIEYRDHKGPRFNPQVSDDHLAAHVPANDQVEVPNSDVTDISSAILRFSARYLNSRGSKYLYGNVLLSKELTAVTPDDHVKVTQPRRDSRSRGEDQNGYAKEHEMLNVNSFEIY